MIWIANRSLSTLQEPIISILLLNIRLRRPHPPTLSAFGIVNDIDWRRGMRSSQSIHRRGTHRPQGTCLQFIIVPPEFLHYSMMLMRFSKVNVNAMCSASSALSFSVKQRGDDPIGWGGSTQFKCTVLRAFTENEMDGWVLVRGTNPTYKCRSKCLFKGSFAEPSTLHSRGRQKVYVDLEWEYWRREPQSFQLVAALLLH